MGAVRVKIIWLVFIARDSELMYVTALKIMYSALEDMRGLLYWYGHLTNDIFHAIENSIRNSYIRKH